MGEDAKRLDLSYTVLLIFIYTILGPFGVTPAVIGVVAILLVRATPILDFAIGEYEAYHGKKEHQRLEQIRSQITESIKRDVSAQYSTEQAGLKAQLFMLTESLKTLQNESRAANTGAQESKALAQELRKENDTLRAEIQSLKTKFEARSDLQPATTDDKAPSKTSSASLTKKLEVPKTVSPRPSIEFTGVSQTPVAQTEPEPQTQPLRFELPSDLARLNPIRPGFTCIGRAVATHGGPCRSYSNEYLPKERLRQAANTLDNMQSNTPGNNFELYALRDLADKMLCIHHGRGCKYDQVDSIAQRWYDGLAPAREQLRKRRQAATTPIRGTTERLSPGSARSEGSRPTSPASSAGGSVSTAATTPDVFDDRSVRTDTDKRPFIFGVGQSVSFGSPSPAPRSSFAT